MSFIKNLTFPPPGSLTPGNITRALNMLVAARHDLGYHQTVTMMLHMLEGAQMWVTKEVSDDLQVSEIPPDDILFEDLDWPHPRLEIFFEDPAIPSFLAVKSTNVETRAALYRATGNEGVLVRPSNETDPENPFITLQAESEDKGHCSAMYKAAELDHYAAGVDQPPNRKPGDLGHMPMPEDENEQLQELGLLLYKVLLFAGSEGHTIRVTHDKPTRKQGGKAGFKNRPRTPRHIVEYLPHHHVEKRKQAREEGKKHEFRGRRGHFRVYKAQRYKQMRGKRQFIYPVPGPDGAIPRRKFVVRK